MALKVYGNGATHWSSQLPRILDGFRQLGHEITPYIDEANLVYSQNDHAQIVRDRAAGVLKPGAKIILTQLDIPEHLFPRFDLAACRTELVAADALCAISRFGQWQLQHYLGLSSTVIYNPIKSVTRRAHPRSIYRFLHVGRRSDANKRAALGVAAIQMLGYGPSDLLLVGSEGGWGDYVGVQNDENLDIAYGSADFVMATSRVEGLCLPVLEAMAAGAIPVVCRDMTTRTELLPPDLFPEYEEVEPTVPSVARFMARYLNDESGAAMADLKSRLHAHYLAHWSDRVSPIGVARAILSVYDTLS